MGTSSTSPSLDVPVVLWNAAAMAPRGRAITRESLGAWVLKGSPLVQPMGELVRTGFARVTGRCVAPTYRTDLVEAGQAVLFWISGGDLSTPPGIYAQGRTTGRVEHDGTALVMPVELGPVSPPILRAEIVQHPSLARIEVVRMAAGSNPSFLSHQHVRALQNTWPQIDVP